MKQFKIAIIATIITVCIIIGCAHACAESNITYPRITTVFETEIMKDCQKVKCIDASRNVWIFYDDDFKWEVGDIANLLIFDYDPKTLDDDEIIGTYWEGYDLNFYYQIMGWRE